MPNEILWRQKEQFSDGVGYSWIDGLKATAEERVSDLQMKFASNRFPHAPPTSKEEYMYREIFSAIAITLTFAAALFLYGGKLHFNLAVMLIVYLVVLLMSAYHMKQAVLYTRQLCLT